MATAARYRVAAPTDTDRRARNQAKACHSLVVRTTAESIAVRRNLRAGAERWPALAGIRLWAETVADGPAAADRVRREAERPLRTGGEPVRVVLLSHPGGVADLVLVARRAEVSTAALRELARLLLEGPENATEPVVLGRGPATGATAARAPGDTGWGVGDPSRAGRSGEVPIVVPETCSEAVLVAAVGLTLTRYSAGESTAVAVLRGDDAGGIDVRSVALDEAATVTAYVAQWDGPDDGELITGAPVPAVGVVLGAAEPHVRHRPFLAPLLPVVIHWQQGQGGATHGVLTHDLGEVAPEVARNFAAQVAYVAARFAVDPRRVLGDVEMMTGTETERVLAMGRTPAAGDPAAARRTIHGRFAEIARRTPDAVALVDGEDEVTYAELDDRAERMAAGLRALGVEAGSLVGIALEPGAEVVTSMLAVLKAGCTYVPMDVRYPEDRLRYTVEDSGAVVVLGSAETFPALDGVRVIAPAEARGLGGREVPFDSPAEDGSRAAYVIYTSGSTGRPKGVVVPHQNVSALIEATREDFALGADDVWTLFHSTAFDFSVWEIWGCLLTGGRLVIVGYWVTRDTELFYELLAERRVTVLNQTPSAFGQLVEIDRRVRGELALRLVVFGGEPLDVRMLAPWFLRHSHTRCRLVNMFGITETTVHVTQQTVTPADVVAGSRSVGRAMPGWSLSVRDPAGRVLPPGVPGEICVGGAGVADRYLGKPELTAERFVEDPHGGGRIYRSGDLGRLRPDGRLDHLGRIDNQVKVRGHRIELDEIRAVLLTHPAVAGAAVVLNHDKPGDSATARIDAYVVLREPASATTLLGHARGVLPAYMVPAGVTEVPAIPLTINGKLDVAALPAPGAWPVEPPPEAGTAVPGEAVESGDSVTTEILGLWSRILNTEVSIDDNFFEIGGNSLFVIRVLREMRDLGLPRVSTHEFYRHSTAARFIELVREQAAVEV